MNTHIRHFGRLLVMGVILGGGPATRAAEENKDREALLAAYRQGENLRQQGRYAQASQAYEKAVALAKRVFGATDLNTAVLLNNLADLYQNQCQYARAESFYLRSLKILEAKLAKDDPLVASVLNNLALLSKEQGDYTKAERIYERSLRMFESRLGKDDLRVATSLNNLAALYRFRGQYTRAQPLLKRSLGIRETKLGKDHPDVAISLYNLASLCYDQGQYAEAQPLYLRSLKIFESQLGKDHPRVATTLNDLALLYSAQGQYSKAGPLLERALTIRESKLGKNHPQVAQSLNGLALLYQVQRRYARAEPLFLRGLKIYESQLGKDHPDVTACLSNVASLYGTMQRWQDAAGFFDRARRSQREHVAKVLPGLAPQDQLLFLHEEVNRNLFGSLSLAVLQPRDAGLVERSEAWLINGKALTQQALAEPLVLARAADRPELRDLLSQLLETRKHLANLALGMPASGQDNERRAQLGALVRQEQRLTRELGQKSGHLLEKQPWTELDSVRKALASDTIFVDIARFPVCNFRATGSEPHWQAARYVAWVVPPVGTGSVQVIDLGEAAKIEAGVAALRAGLQKTPTDNQTTGVVDAEKELTRRLQALARIILQPLLPHIRKSRRWVISPDASLWLVPWAALPLLDGSYAVEKYTISHVISGRDLIPPGAASPRAPGRPLVLADPDFDLAPGRGEATGPWRRGLLSQERLPRFTRLPGTAAEARAVAPLLERYGNVKPEVLTGKAALEQRFKAARRPRVLVLSTHGFFLADQADVSPVRSVPASRSLTLVANGLPEPRRQSVKALENPLLRCGLALAGANQRDKVPEGADDGILTGLEIVGTDLRGTELVVLSACETGLGKVHFGEGVAGLRQAFQLAGARAVVATLWQIPDRETTALMTAFFENLAAKKGKAEALRLAQLKIIKERQAKNKAAHPFYWAAFTLTGQ
jgi:CHAT domain-containing protein/tetratricopeptide (TPR) repeat protein